MPLQVCSMLICCGDIPGTGTFYAACLFYRLTIRSSSAGTTLQLSRETLSWLIHRTTLRNYCGRTPDTATEGASYIRVESRQDFRRKPQSQTMDVAAMSTSKVKKQSRRPRPTALKGKPTNGLAKGNRQDHARVAEKKSAAARRQVRVVFLVPGRVAFSKCVFHRISDDACLLVCFSIKPQHNYCSTTEVIKVANTVLFAKISELPSLGTFLVVRVGSVIKFDNIYQSAGIRVLLYWGRPEYLHPEPCCGSLDIIVAIQGCSLCVWDEQHRIVSSQKGTYY